MIGAYLVVALVVFSLLYAVQLYNNKSFILKLINVTVLVCIASAVYFTFETYKGWPTIEKQNEKARVFAVLIEPPVKGENDGAIYYWVIERKVEDSFWNKVFRYESDMPNSPRSYFIPYSPEAEKVFSRAQQALENGEIVFMDPNDESKDGTGDGKKPGQGEESDAKNKGRNGQEPKYDVPSLEIITPEEFMGKQPQ
jgi:hypothetical protein